MRKVISLVISALLIGFALLPSNGTTVPVYAAAPNMHAQQTCTNVSGGILNKAYATARICYDGRTVSMSGNVSCTYWPKGFQYIRETWCGWNHTGINNSTITIGANFDQGIWPFPADKHCYFRTEYNANGFPIRSYAGGGC